MCVCVCVCYKEGAVPMGSGEESTGPLPRAGCLGGLCGSLVSFPFALGSSDLEIPIK